MKKYLIIGLGLISVISSCKKSELELFPYNQIETTQAFTNEAGASLALNGMYYGLRVAGGYYVQNWAISNEVASDNVIINSSGPGRLSQRFIHNWQYNGDNTIGLFQDGYTMVRRANAIIENIDKVPSTPAFINNTKGQALACRAMVYFDLARVYSKSPLNASATDYTVPYVTTTIDPTIKPANESISGFYDKIIADLNAAKSLIAVSNPVGQLNLTAVNALLSKVYLYKGDYTNCIAASSSALGNTPSLSDLTTCPLVWKDASEAGVIFKIKNTDLDGITTQGVNYYQKVAGGIKSEYVVDYAFYQLFTVNDVRKAAYTAVSPYNGTNQIHVVKFAGRTGSPAGNLDAKVLRAAEVLLNRAEAYYKSGNEPMALADIILLKSKRYIGYVNDLLAGQALLDEINLQRRLEMAFEGDRFLDLKRRNLPVQRSTFGDISDGTGITYVFKTLAAGDYKFNFPIPQNEINFNTNLKQVPGY